MPDDTLTISNPSGGRVQGRWHLSVCIRLQDDPSFIAPDLQPRRPPSKDSRDLGKHASENMGYDKPMTVLSLLAIRNQDEFKVVLYDVRGS